MRRYFKIFLVAYVCVLAIWLCLPTSESVPTESASTNAVSKPLVGIWQGENGVMIEMRLNGTTRSRRLDDSSNAIRYSGYRQVGDELFIDYIAKPDEYLRRIRESFSGTNHEHFRILTLTDDQLELMDIVSGRKISFSRIEDKLLSEAP